MYKKILYLCGMILLMSACSDKTWFQEATIEFSLSKRIVEIEPGDTAVIHVSGELEFAVKSQNENVATVYRDGRRAVITAIAEGETDVMFLSQFNDIVCKVVVKEQLSDNDGQKLDDPNIRIKGSGISLIYGEPGVMIMESVGYVEFIDLDTAVSVKLFCPQEGNIQGVEINGVEYGIQSCQMLKATDNRLWYLVLLDSEKIEGFWAVIEKRL